MSCADCFVGTVHEGTPAGYITELHGLATYVAEPSDKSRVRGIVVIIPDAWGWTLPNTRVLADKMAGLGNFLVYLPDFMKGHAVPLTSLDIVPSLLSTTGWKTWLYKPYHFLRLMFSIVPFFIRNRFSVSVPIVRAFFQSLRVHEAANIPLGVAGYCWGGKHATILASGEAQPNGWPLVDSVFVGHPGGLKVPQDIEKIRVPYSVAVGDRDFVLKQKNVLKITETLNKRKDILTEVKIYPGARHGFALRGNPGDKQEKSQGEAAMWQAVEWLLESLCKAEEFARVGKGML